MKCRNRHTNTLPLFCEHIGHLSWAVAHTHPPVLSAIYGCFEKLLSAKTVKKNNLTLVCLSNPRVCYHLTFWGQAGIDLLATREQQTRLEMSSFVKHHLSFSPSECLSFPLRAVRADLPEDDWIAHAICNLVIGGGNVTHEPLAWIAQTCIMLEWCKWSKALNHLPLAQKGKGGCTKEMQSVSTVGGRLITCGAWQIL